MSALLENLKMFTLEGDEIMTEFICIILGYNTDKYIEAAKAARLWGKGL